MSTTGDPVLLGIDLGTSAVKVLAVTLDGTQLALRSEFYGLIASQTDMVEQDADVVYDAMMRVLRDVLADDALRGRTVHAIGLSSAMHGVLAVDDTGKPLGHVLTWLDTRASAIVERWRDDGTAHDVYRRTGAPMHPMLPLAKLRWLCDREPALVARAARFVGLKELVVFRWTGDWLVDWGIAAATGLLRLDASGWDDRALGLAGIDAERLATPVAPSTQRTLRAPIARDLGLDPRTPIVLCSSDGALANIGVGASGVGELALTLGTSGAVRVLVDTPQLDDDARTFCYRADDTRSIVGGPTNAAGASLDWIFALLLADIAQPERFSTAAREAAGVEPGARGCLVLPFFSGERAPYWRSGLRGSFERLDRTHDRATILRAAFESVVYGVYAVAEVVRSIAGEPTRLLTSGGLTKSALVRSLVADIFGVPTIEPHQTESSAFGAALLAGEAVGAFARASDVARNAGYADPVTPDAARHEAYRAHYDRYATAVRAHLAHDVRS